MPANNKIKFWDINPPQTKPPTRLIFNYTPTHAIPRRRSIKIKIILLILAVLLTAGSVIFVIGLLSFKNNAISGAAVITKNLKTAAVSLKNFDFQQAHNSFQSINSQAESLSSQSQRLGLTTIAKKIGQAFSNLSLFSQTAVDLGKQLMELNHNGFKWLMNQDGKNLINGLEAIQHNMNQLADISNQLQQQAAEAGYTLSDNYSSISADLYRNQGFLEAILDWLKATSERHFLLLFQNSSEIRPGGGFVGSYADITLREGSLINIDVRDIYDPDGQLELKVVPPKPLQLITARWGARDANWFFDFPLSTAKIIKFLETSKIYQERNVKFDGALAMNIEVLKDILAITGPLSLSEYNLEINNENFLAAIQREVEAGADKKAGQPKRILKVLTPLLMNRLSNLSETEKQTLMIKLAERFRHKDIMIYFKDLAIESYLKSLGVAGDELRLPNGFSGDYLAVINANIGGAKSDAFIMQNISVNSIISSAGEIQTQLTVQRTHNGQNQSDWWYRATNKNYIQIILPLGSKLVTVAGNEWINIKPPVNYASYVEDTDVATIEKSSKFLDEFNVREYAVTDKTIFGTWLITKSGTTKTLMMKYLNPNHLEIKDGAVYTFILEKQSGVNSSFQLSIKAPPGYVWQESGNTTFNYVSDDVSARLIINATLRKQ